MSGGSLDYFCFRVGDVAEAIEARAENPTHRAFAAHLRKVSDALHDLEWVWSGDKGPGDELKALLAVVSPADVLAQAVADARQALTDLTVALAHAEAPGQDGQSSDPGMKP